MKHTDPFAGMRHDDRQALRSLPWGAAERLRLEAQASTVTDPKLHDPDVGSPDDMSHYARKEDIVRANVEGGLVEALCGVEFQPLRDPQKYPVCPRCAELLEQLGNRSLS